MCTSTLAADVDGLRSSPSDGGGGDEKISPKEIPEPYRKMLIGIRMCVSVCLERVLV